MNMYEWYGPAQKPSRIFQYSNMDAIGFTLSTWACHRVFPLTQSLLTLGWEVWGPRIYFLYGRILRRQRTTLLKRRMRYVPLRSPAIDRRWSYLRLRRIGGAMPSLKHSFLFGAFIDYMIIGGFQSQFREFPNWPISYEGVAHWVLSWQLVSEPSAEVNRAKCGPAAVGTFFVVVEARGCIRRGAYLRFWKADLHWKIGSWYRCRGILLLAFTMLLLVAGTAVAPEDPQSCKTSVSQTEPKKVTVLFTYFHLNAEDAWFLIFCCIVFHVCLGILRYFVLSKSPRSAKLKSSWTRNFLSFWKT